MNDDRTRWRSPGIARSSVLLKSRASWFSRFNCAQFLQSSTSSLSVNLLIGFAWIFLLLSIASPANAAVLKAKTIRAFDQYVQNAELRMHNELNSRNSFLWIDSLSSSNRAAAYARLRNGQILVHPLAAGLEIPGGMIHDWIGLAFIPNTTLNETLAQIQNYSTYAQIYSPQVVRSKILRHDGNNFEVSLWLQSKSLVTVVLNVVQNVKYLRLDASRAYSCAHSIRIAEVENPGAPSEHEVPWAVGHGYLWKLNDYSWFLQTPAGVYVQFEAIALSRDIPWGLGWLIKPFVTKIPRESLVFTLAHTRASLEAATLQSAKVDGGSPSAANLNEILARNLGFARNREQSPGNSIYP